ncbi:hypothetical protein T439DRAFT_324026 [Meredithblackwellia eburnea MCA 4105]
MTMANPSSSNPFQANSSASTSHIQPSSTSNNQQQSEQKQHQRTQFLKPRPSSSNSLSTNTANNAARPLKKRRHEKGRNMMVKVFYSLSSPRFDNNNQSQQQQSTSSHPTPQPLPTQASSPNFPLDPALADLALPPAPSPLPTPAPAPPPQPSQPQNNYTCIARVSSPVFVQLLGTPANNNNAPGAGRDGNTPAAEYGMLTLKTCLSTICISRPELVTDPSKDYAVSAVDPYESSLRSSNTSTSISSSSNTLQSGAGSDAGQGLMEGKGMLSWNLAEKREGTTFVCGRVVPNPNTRERRAVERERRRTEAVVVKKRKLESGEAASAQTEDDDADDDDDSEDEYEEEEYDTLEVWLQLVESNSFTHHQFLTSLRSFANPPSSQFAFSSERGPSPPRRPFPVSLSQSQSQSHSQPFQSRPPAPPSRPSHLGDPVKKKRPRPDGTSSSRPPLGPLPHASATTQPLSSTASASLQNPQLASLLSQILPTLTGSSGPVSTGLSANNAKLTSVLASLDTPEGRALLPAIRTLIKFQGLEVPEGGGNAPAIGGDHSSTAVLSSENRSIDKGKGRARDEGNSSFALGGQGQPQPLSVAAAVSESTSATVGSGAAQVLAGTRPRGRPPKPKVLEKEMFPALAVPPTKGNLNPLNPEGGCSNCMRKKSAVWRQGEGGGGVSVVVCNACGTYFNKNGHHRATGDRTSPARVPGSSNMASSRPPAAGKVRSSIGRPLQGRLSATCEADLKKVKKRRMSTAGASASTSKGAGIVLPPSPSKHVGPASKLRSPGSIFHHNYPHGGRTIPGQILTSPCRSPRLRTATRGGAVMFGTSPVRRSGGISALGGSGVGPGPKDDYVSDGEQRDGIDFSFFNVQQSPSPQKRAKVAIPSYLLTASPGTALARILDDTTVDKNHLDAAMGDAHPATSTSASGTTLVNPFQLPPSVSAQDEDDMSFFIHSSPEDGKENTIPPSGLTGSLEASTDVPSTSADYDSLLSSLRRDFNTRLSSNALTAPSSPVSSSPCVQPRTSSATPGQKSKAPASCGRPAPSILDSFIDTLVPAFTLNHPGDGETPVSDSDAWTPVSVGDQDVDRTIMQLDQLQQPSNAGTTSDAVAAYNRTGHFVSRRPHLPFHLTNRLGAATSDDFDLRSLPPSSPPALLSEAVPTPSEFDSGVTPEEEGYVESGDDSFLHASGAFAPTVSQDAVAAFLQSLGASSNGVSTSVAAGVGEGLLPGAASDKISLDRSTVAQLLQMISGSGGGAVQAQSSIAPATSASTSTSHSTAPSPFEFDVFGAQDHVPTPTGLPIASQEEQHDQHHEKNMDELYQSLFSNSGDYDPQHL